MNRFKIWIKVMFNFIMSLNCCNKAKILSAEETISLIVKDKKSIIRLGDGEFNILQGKDVHYQKYSAELKTHFENILENYLNNPKQASYIICMPGEFFICNGFKLIKKRVYVASWSFSRYIFKKKYDKDITYGDAFLFANGNEKIYSKIWTNTGVKNIIFVHNQEIYAKEFEDKYKISTESVVIPPRDAFENSEHILKKIIKIASERNDLLVLISAGPCAKYLVYKLALNGIWAIDTGHCWDSPLRLRSK
ncbi:protein of unknown function [Hathewaya proteolytica DSM 3090]|uniref:Glycosyltransferase GT-D fold domain-containing protein n=1 Tax=Hathewaya proteolytica DSM 3090 TaxID=1121331 RepID=A0A1M6Q291_9CLOT|nr:GT-D fold domain-containing glycosyltransferase [Hathewaya proteolytica]SHK14330.1 protein of unknown function [Hathewaya proteolytica DSM 3090]